MEGAGEGRIGDWSEVVTRYPYGNVGMDHLLSMEKANTEVFIKEELKSFYLVLRDRNISQKVDL